MKFILLSCLCLPIAAQVQWLSSSSPAATNPVYGTAEKSRVCRVSQGGNSYAGVERLSVCDTVVAGAAQGSTNYEIAVGLGKWEASGLSGAATLGNIAGLPSRVCRFQSGNNMAVGYTEGNPAVCRGLASGSVASNNKFEVLYDFTTSGDFHILQNGLCVSAVTTQNTLSQAIPPVVLRACSGSNLLSDRWKLQVSGGGLKIESGLFGGQCLRSATVVLLAGVATQPGVELVSCASAPVLNFEWFDDTTFRIRNPVSNEVMGRWKAGLQAGVPPMFKTADGGASEGFEVLTVNEASRRLSVVSYNTMCLPDDQFPLMKQDERAGAIPDQLNRLGALPDVMALQEGFTLEKA
ncbi:MAG: hypothetical protein NTW74_15270, partial [Acidobacteria bacterium]|nr:hypothetical protein [Acidobacteriota bacterium]